MADVSTATTTLPNVESTAVVFIRFTNKADNELINLVKERLIGEGLQVITDEEDDLIFGITASQERLEMEAQAIRLLKKRHDTNIIDALDIEQKEKFCNKTIPYRDSIGLFSPNDRALLVSQILDDTAVLNMDESSSPLAQKLDSINKPFLEKLAPSVLVVPEKFRLLARGIVGNEQPRRCLLHELQSGGYVDVVAPVHTVTLKDEIWKHVSAIRIMPPVELIREYYGEEIAFYFAWMGFYTTWLFFPGLVGFIASLHRWYRKDTIMNDEYTPFYGIVTFFWSVLFLKWWQRHESRLCYRWGVLVGEFEKKKYFAVRPEFYGTYRVSPVTGQVEAFYPDYKRRLKFVVSALVTATMLYVAFWIMILSLNMQGYINPKHHPERWHEGNSHPFHWPSVSRLAERGGVFDVNSNWRSLIPVALHVTTIFTLNTLYRMVATRLTKWENHQTQLQFSNSLILKRFLFEAFDCYVALFYLAFYERNIDKLGSELISVFNLDTVRRLALECLVPMFLQRVTKKNRKEKWDIHKKTDDSPLQKHTPLADQAELDEYEQFDDYMEIIIQFGYVTLFASAYPLASMISIVANLIEIRADAFKISYVCRRPRSSRCDGLNVWKNLLQCIVSLSALTNCLILGYSSGQLKEWLPHFYEMDDTDHMHFRDNKGWIVVFIIFGLERGLIYAGLLLDAVIPDVPEDVMNELERKHYVLEQESREFERLQALKRSARKLSQRQTVPMGIVEMIPMDIPCGGDHQGKPHIFQ